MPSSIVPSLKCRMCLKMNPPGSRFCNYCGNDLTFSIQPDGLLPSGAVLRGSYVVGDVIGEGGMGVVYSCRHKSLGTRYALKVLDPKLARMDVLRRRFLSEARIQAEVVHPHIVHVMDVIDSDKDGGIPGILAIVMEYVDGEALDKILERSPLSVHDAVSCTLVILDAIGFAHHKGIIHRDLKPSNIMVERALSEEMLYRGIKVMDFGIAKILSADEQRTVTGAKMGTPRYMAPEQIENAREVDERTDLYAIGLTLYELLCGRTPFEMYKEFELLKAQLSMKPPTMRTYRSDIPDRLEAIVMKSLEKERQKRYPNAESFQRALLSLGGYDEIALRLNPREGVAVSLSNQKLQRQIERAIDRTKSKDGAGAEGDTAQRRPGRRKTAKPNAPASDENGGARAPQTAGETAAGKKKPPQAGAFDGTENQAPIRARRPAKKNATLPSGSFFLTKDADGAGAEKADPPLRCALKVSKERLSGTSQRALKRAKADERAKRAQSGAPQALQAPAQSEVSVCAQKTDAQGASVSAQTARCAPKARTVSGKGVKSAERFAPAAPPEKKTKEYRPDGESCDGSAAAGKAVCGGGAAQRSGAKKSGRALKIVFAALAILCIFGMAYRWWNQMPDSVAPRAEDPNIPAQAQPEDVLPDISRAALAVRQTSTGCMTVIPKAEHWISTGKPREISRRALGAFAVDQTEVSHYQYEKCVAAQACPPLSAMPADLNMPVTHVGFGTAEAFCKFAGKTLPTEEQWEAAARFGSDSDGIADVAVSCETVHCGSDKGGECRKVNPPHPQSVFGRMNGANRGHILNMLGNVREWTQTVGKDNQMRVTKGGSYLTPKKAIGSGAREETRANEGAPDLGFRCVMEL